MNISEIYVRFNERFFRTSQMFVRRQTCFWQWNVFEKYCDYDYWKIIFNSQLNEHVRSEAINRYIHTYVHTYKQQTTFICSYSHVSGAKRTHQNWDKTALRDLAYKIKALNCKSSITMKSRNRKGPIYLWIPLRPSLCCPDLVCAMRMTWKFGTRHRSKMTPIIDLTLLLVLKCGVR